MYTKKVGRIAGAGASRRDENARKCLRGKSLRAEVAARFARPPRKEEAGESEDQESRRAWFWNWRNRKRRCSGARAAGRLNAGKERGVADSQARPVGERLVAVQDQRAGGYG